MLEAIYVVLVFGCADDLGGCRLIDRVDEGWRFATTCEASVTDVLMRNTDADFPMVTAECGLASDPVIAGKPAEQQARPAG